MGTSSWWRRIRSPYVLSLALAAGCRKPDTTQLVVGIQSDPMGGVVTALHVVIKVAGKVVDDEHVQPPHGSRVGFPQPWEKSLSGAGQGAARVEVEVEAMGDPSAKPLFTRLASTYFAPGARDLLRVPLESRCIVYPAMPRGASRIPGPLSGPTCTAPATCVMGACLSSEVPVANLEAYAPSWPANAPDRCKPRGGGPPDLQVGTGQSSYLPVTPGQVLQAEAGPQGGHHVWIAARMKNLKQRGSLTRISGLQPGTNVSIPPTTLAFTYGPDERGYCKLAGIRYQLDNEGIDYKQFLGKPLDVTVTVTDASGTTATSTAHIQVAPTLLNP
ncbi:MAG: hypothetical protein ACRENE_25575 [Polyangiaceae bacterium]